jgi:hypothetical protein
LTVDPTWKANHVKEPTVHAITSCNVPITPEAEKFIKAMGSLFYKAIEGPHRALTEMLSSAKGMPATRNVEGDSSLEEGSDHGDEGQQVAHTELENEEASDAGADGDEDDPEGPSASEHTAGGAKANLFEQFQAFEQWKREHGQLDLGLASMPAAHATGTVPRTPKGSGRTDGPPHTRSATKSVIVLDGDDDEEARPCERPRPRKKLASNGSLIKKRKAVEDQGEDSYRSAKARKVDGKSKERAVSPGPPTKAKKGGRN